jgi:sugar lactone lactonase YvrE
VTDDAAGADFEEVEHPLSRTRVVLSTILVILVLMLIGLGYFTVKVVTPAGTPQGSADLPTGLEWVRSVYGFGPAESQQFRRPVDVAVAPDGSFWGTDPSRNRVLGFNSDGSFKSLIHTGPASKEARKLGQPEGVAVGEDGLVYVVDGSNQKIMVFTQANVFVREWSVPSPLVCSVRGGRVYVGCAPGVAVFSTDGKLLSVWGKAGYGPEEFLTVHGIAVAADGTVYVSDTNNLRIKAYKPDGTLLWVWPKSRTTASVTGLQAKDASSTPLLLPTGMTMDGRGRLVVADAFSFDIAVLQPTKTGATVVARYGDYGRRDGYFAYPTGVSYDPNRDWFAVADTANDRLQIVRLPGSGAPGAAAAATRVLYGLSPWCAVPIVLLLIAVVVAFTRRRAVRRSNDAGAGVKAAESIT